MAEPSDTKLSRNTRPFVGFMPGEGELGIQKSLQRKVTPYGVVTAVLQGCSLWLPFGGFGHALDKLQLWTYPKPLTEGTVGINLSLH